MYLPIWTFISTIGVNLYAFNAAFMCFRVEKRAPGASNYVNRDRKLIATRTNWRQPAAWSIDRRESARERFRDASKIREWRWNDAILSQLDRSAFCSSHRREHSGAIQLIRRTKVTWWWSCTGGIIVADCKDWSDWRAYVASRSNRFARISGYYRNFIAWKTYT